MSNTTVRTLVPASFSRTDTASYTLDDIRKEVNEICVWLDYLWGHEKKMQSIRFRLEWNEKPRPKTIGLCHKDGDENFVNDFVFSVDDIAEGECVGFAVG